MLKPLLEKVVAQYDGKVSLAKVDVDQNQELATRYGVSSVPLVVAFTAGKPGAAFTGAIPESGVVSFVKGVIGEK